jgi:transposase
MLRPPASVRVFLCLEPADMRRSFDGLCAMVAGIMRDDPLSGHLFVFRSRRADRVKVLYWDRDGLVILYKRLERGTFRFPVDAGAAAQGRLEVPMRDFAMILEGFDLHDVKGRRRF